MPTAGKSGPCFLSLAVARTTGISHVVHAIADRRLLAGPLRRLGLRCCTETTTARDLLIRVDWRGQEQQAGHRSRLFPDIRWAGAPIS